EQVVTMSIHKTLGFRILAAASALSAAILCTAGVAHTVAGAGDVAGTGVATNDGAPTRATAPFVGRFALVPLGVEPQAIALADLDRDGVQDLIVTHWGTDLAKPDSLVRVLLGDGRGGFTPKGDYPTGGSPLSIAVADVDHDGILDVLVANTNARSVSVLYG